MEIIQDLNKPVDDNTLDTNEIRDEIVINSNPKDPEPKNAPEEPEKSCGCQHDEPTEKKCCCLCNSNILSIVALVGVIILFILFFCTKGHKSAPAAPIAQTENGLTIAYVDTDSLMAKYQYAIDVTKELEQYRNAQENSYKRQMTQFQNDYQKYMQDGPNMTLTQQQNKEAELKQRAEKLQNLEGELTLQIQKRTLAESEKMTRAIYAFIKEYNESHSNFTLILAKSFSSSPILYGNEGMDITDEIIQGLNDEYKKVKGKKK